MKVFGRITADKEICKKISQELLNVFLMCYEGVDDGCLSPHCHFVGETKKEYKTIASFRQRFNKVCIRDIGKANQYSIKEMNPEQEWERYLCKGSKKDRSIFPEILINNSKTDVLLKHTEFHDEREAIKQNRNNKVVWREFETYIQENNPDLFRTCSIQEIFTKVAEKLYEFFIEQDKMFLSETVMRNIITTIVARNIKETRQEFHIKEAIYRRWIPYME